jgi:hypothetical protein
MNEKKVITKNVTIAVALACLLIGVGIGFVVEYYILNAEIDQLTKDFKDFEAYTSKMRAVKYLISGYNSTVGLIPEVPSWFEPLPLNHLYWLTSDNMLAYYALKNYDAAVSNAILNKIKGYAINYSLPVNSEGVPISYKHEVLIGTALPETFNLSNYYHLSKTPLNLISYDDIVHYAETINPIIVAEVNNRTTIMSDWANYADMLLYKAVDCHLKNNTTEAVELFKNASAMWDGYGLNDIVYNSSTQPRYEVYKLCLLEYVRKLLKQPYLPYESQLVNRIFSAQQSNGGIITHYTKTGEYLPYAYTNTETTAIFLIADVEYCM